MGDGEAKSAKIPFLEARNSGSASTLQTLANIVVSIVGTGVLGLPYALRVAGWLAGSLGVAVAGVATYFCMLMLVSCREKLASEDEEASKKTYGDLGYESMGVAGRIVAETLIFVSQCGGSMAYLVFIGQNLWAVSGGRVAAASFVVMLVPVEIALTWVGSLKALAPFSVFANVCNVLAMAIVVKEDVQHAVESGFSFGERTAVRPDFAGVAMAGGMAVFCFEGFGMTLALEGSMRDKGRFPRLLGHAFSGITLLYVVFGFMGYMAFGDQTRDIVTLNLPRDCWALAVQMGMCLGLVFTFPVMVHPVNEIIEGRLNNTNWFRNDTIPQTPSTLWRLGAYVTRALLVVGLAFLALCVPGFAVFASLVGSTVCALISFVLPAIFHLTIVGPSLTLPQRALDVFVLSCGVIFALYGTYTTLASIA